MGIPDHLTCSWKICTKVKNKLLEADMEQQTGSYLGKELHQGCILSQCLFNLYAVQFNSVAQLCPTLCDPRNHARPPSPSPTPGVHQNPCPLCQWCHPAISFSVVPFSSCPQSFPESEFFQTSQLFASDSQIIGVSASTSILPMNTQDWSPLGWTGWISFQSKGLSRVFNTIVQKHQFFRRSAFFTVQLSHPYMTTGKTIALTRCTFVGKFVSAF